MFSSEEGTSLKKTIFIIFTILVISIVLVIAIIMIIFNPIVSLRFSPEWYIKRGVLKYTPIGTDIGYVVDYINKNNDWTFSTSGGAKLWSMLSEDEINEIYSSGSIYVCIGEYDDLFKVDVQVIWFFDDDSEVERVFVRKIVNGI